MKAQNWSLVTRLLHVGMVLSVSFQLFISLVMVEPDHKGGALGRLAFESHEIVGLAALTIVLLHWAWSIFNQVDGGLRNLFPWFGNSRQQVVNEARAVLKGKLPEGGNRGGLVGLIHGLGLLAVTGVVLTGGALFVLFPENGEPGVIAEAIAELHEGVAALVWTYWLGHGGMAIIHHAMGQDNVKKMFDFRFTKKTVAKLNDDHAAHTL